MAIQKNLMFVQLVVASGPRAGQTIPIAGEKFIIGRAKDCHLRPHSDLISRYHCTIVTDDGTVRVRDLGSKNGVRVNNEKINAEQILSNGDSLVIGTLEFIVNITTDPGYEPETPAHYRAGEESWIFEPDSARRSEGSSQNITETIKRSTTHGEDATIVQE